MLTKAFSGAMPSPRISTRRLTLSSCTAAGSLRASASLPRSQKVSTLLTICFSMPGWLPNDRRRASDSARFTVMSRQRLPSKYCHSVMVGTRGPEDPGMASKKRSTAASSLNAFRRSSPR